MRFALALLLSAVCFGQHHISLQSPNIQQTIDYVAGDPLYPAAGGDTYFWSAVAPWNKGLGGVTVESNGAGYTSDPTMSVANCSGYTATFVRAAGKLVRVDIAITATGTCTTGSHAVTFSGGGASVQATGAALPVIIGSLNDGTAYTIGYSGYCGTENVNLQRLTSWSVANPLNTRIDGLNCMTSYGSGYDQPAGWGGSYGPGSGGTDATWKSRAPVFVGGNLILPVLRQQHAGAYMGDSTWILSPDLGQHWCNPYHYMTHSGAPGCDSSNWDANGDAPSYTTGYSQSMLFQGTGLNTNPFAEIYPLDFGQDGVKSTPPDSICDPAVNMCFHGTQQGNQLRYFGYVPLASLMDRTAIKIYTASSAGTNCNSPGSFSSYTSLASATSIQSSGDANKYFGTAYIPAFQSYLLAGYYQSSGQFGSVFGDSLSVCGPVAQIVTNGVVSNYPMAGLNWGGFLTPMTYLGYVANGDGTVTVWTAENTQPPYLGTYSGGSPSWFKFILRGISTGLFPLPSPVGLAR